jgi:predicted TIM-barrel fold metal-dependent hydrolase
MAIVVHMRANTSQPMGRAEALLFLNELLPAAPDVTVQIAHLGGAGGVEASIVEDVLGVFADAIATGDRRVQHVWFDITSVVMTLTPTQATRVVERIRQLGVQRMLFGSDAPAPNNVLRLTWAAFRTLPLSDEEFRTIERNLAPYLR